MVELLVKGIKFHPLILGRPIMVLEEIKIATSFQCESQVILS